MRVDDNHKEPGQTMAPPRIVAGFKVVDLSPVVDGPTEKMLAEHGAEVTR